MHFEISYYNRPLPQKNIDFGKSNKIVGYLKKSSQVPDFHPTLIPFANVCQMPMQLNTKK